MMNVTDDVWWGFSVFTFLLYFKGGQNVCICKIGSSSRPEVFCKKGVLRNFAKFTGKNPCQSLFFRKKHRWFPVNFAKFLRTPFLIEHLRRLLLDGTDISWALKNNKNQRWWWETGFHKPLLFYYAFFISN